jgi:hypothetical protein
VKSECGRWLGLVCLVLGTFSIEAVAAAEKGAQLPDWSGWWVLTVRISDEWEKNPPPLKPEDLARYRASRRDDSNPDPGRFCRPPQFTGYSGGFTEAVEFLFTPGRVTFTNEGGLIRRIYTDGRALPAVREESNTGLSMGRWEGQTLVVETVNINPRALYPLHTTHGAMPIGRNAKITERISLQGPDKLLFDIETVAPDLFVAPDRRRRTYTRVANKTTAQEFNLCVDHDRQIDPVTGQQRFDLTPPRDLPPPPPKAP